MKLAPKQLFFTIVLVLSGATVTLVINSTSPIAAGYPLRNLGPRYRSWHWRGRRPARLLCDLSSGLLAFGKRFPRGLRCLAHGGRRTTSDHQVGHCNPQRYDYVRQRQQVSRQVLASRLMMIDRFGSSTEVSEACLSTGVCFTGSWWSRLR